MINRRTLLQFAGAGIAATPFAPLPVFAAAPTSKRFVLLILRGGADGLHMLAPWADRAYRDLRPGLALHRDGAPRVLDLDGYFAFHPALEQFAALYQQRELAVLPAATTRYRDRSHFDGQNLLENGTAMPYGAADGWLNRSVALLNEGDRRLGLALGPRVPLVLQGSAAVQTWSDSQLPEVSEEFLFRLEQIYSADEAFASTLELAQGTAPPDIDDSSMRSNPLRGPSLSLSAQAAASFLARADGPRIAVLESQGWDTHFDQERRLSQLFTEVAGAIMDLRTGLGEAWRETAVMVVSEFGRTAAENGSRGTDHGTGGIAVLAGGAIHGGRLLGDWPGLSPAALYEGRDLRATSFYEAAFKSVLIEHMGLAQSVVEDSVFPDSAAVTPMDNLFRS